jgi:hypothetical protein
MGKLVEQPLKTFFNGVSRQPANVRLANQLEEADNVMPSVVSGGFEKRPATQHIRTLSELSAANNTFAHFINRDANEQYLVTITSGVLRVFRLTDGVAQTVNAPAADATTYITSATPDTVFRATTVADNTIITNTAKVTALAAAGSGTITGTRQTFAALPAASGSTGQIWKVSGDQGSDFSAYFVQSDGSVWNEVAAPNAANAFDKTSLPYRLVRNSGGDWTLAQAPWTDRSAGDATSVPPPLFIGKTIADATYFRGRVGLLGDEYVYFSQAGDAFNLWPEHAYTNIASDPIELSAGNTSVNLLKWAVPFRKALFLTSDNAQFEVGGEGKLTPDTATMDETTRYQIDAGARPALMGDQLYFVGKAQGRAAVYEYYYNGDSFSNVAAEVSKHVEGYIPGDMVRISASTLGNRVFFLSNQERNNLYVYTSYWNGTEKVQSAWSRYQLGTSTGVASIVAAQVIGDYVYALVKRNNVEMALERFPVSTEVAPAGLGFAPLLDRRFVATGVYDAVNDWTTWTVPYTHANDVQIVLGTAFTGKVGKRLSNLTYPTTTSVRVSGDYSAGSAYLGTPYTMSAELSAQYVRNQETGAASTEGVCIMRTMTINFKDSGYIQATVTPKARAAKTFKMSGKVLGDALVVGAAGIVERGSFRFRVDSRSDTAQIVISNDTPYPSVITSGHWVGFYNNIPKQG